VYVLYVMKSDPNYNGIGPGPEPIPTPGKCAHCDTDMDVHRKLNEGVENIITTFRYKCPDCEAVFIDRP